MLLSEVADKIRNEILTWPSHRDMTVQITVSPSLDDARDGNEGILTEMLVMPVGLISVPVSDMNIEITGDSEELVISFEFKSTEPGDRLPKHWQGLGNKARDWNPRIVTNGNCMTIHLELPSASVSPPVNLETMARETGIQLEEAWLILEEFIARGKTYFEVLNDKSGAAGYEERFRAAHSLKGAGKTLRAPELAAAARALESKIGDNEEYSGELHRLLSAWNRIEFWLEGEGP